MYAKTFLSCCLVECSCTTTLMQPLFVQYLSRICLACVKRGSDECLFSREGVTQDDPLSIHYYLLVKSLKVNKRRLQTWYADDSA